MEEPTGRQTSREQVIQIAIIIQAAASRVWKVVTDPELISEWLSDSHIKVVSDWREDSPILFTGKWGHLRINDKGVIRKLDKEKLFSYTFLSGISRLPDLPENYSLIEFALAADGNGTRLTFTQSNFPGKAAYEHSRFYWSTTIGMIKELAEKPD